ncbi:hypothetical protein ACHAXR_013136 [Thalassiosira sp. AJA248-18]
MTIQLATLSSTISTLLLAAPCSPRKSRNIMDGIIYDKCVHELESNGYALLPLPTLLQHSEKKSSIAQAFETARRALDVVSDNVDANVPLIDPSSDSGSWTGYHNAAVVNGRYNQHREGFVFSNGEIFDVMLNNGDDDCNFENEMNKLYSVMHGEIAEGVLMAIERRLNLPHLYFHQELGPTNKSSQWHMKRYVVDSAGDGIGAERENSANDNSSIFLPMHTDPSLISVVIIDQAGTNIGGMGLEVFHPSKTRTDSKEGAKSRSHSGNWKEISHHGHDVAVIFIGSVLSYLTKRQVFSAAKHRVVNWDKCCDDDTDSNAANNMNGRMAATLFVRPNANAVMKTLPSPQLQLDDANKNPPTFRAWNARVAKNYMKKK